MKQVYPVILTPEKEGGYSVAIPDLNINTQGDNLAEAIDMARDAIGMWAVYEQDSSRKIPPASDISAIQCDTGDTVALVDIDIDAYRRAHDNRTVRTNVTLPGWLKDAAEKQGVNFSQVLQEALKERLHIQ